MVSFDVSYFLQALPPASTLNYLSRTYGWKPICSSDQPIYLFLCYRSSAFSESFIITASKFPDLCKLDCISFNHNRFILAGNLEDIMNLRGYFSQLDCQGLKEEFVKQTTQKNPKQFLIRDQVWNTDEPRIMGVLNVTPDSFYEGSRYFKHQDYALIAEKMILAGADLIDIGGESTRPGSQSIDEQEEIKRILPALQQIRHRFEIPISIDTTKPKVAEVALEHGADMINDVSGLASGREMIDIVKKHQASYCLMHCQGTPESMQVDPKYDDVIAEVVHFFHRSMLTCREGGLELDRIMIDPGIGFGKRQVDNFDLLKYIGAFNSIGSCLMLGTSNKSFIGNYLGRSVEEREAGTLGTLALGWRMGATFFRVHNVEGARDTLNIAKAYTN